MSLLTKSQTNAQSENRLDFADSSSVITGLLTRISTKLIMSANFLVQDKGKSPPGGL